MDKFVNLHTHTHYSIQDSVIKPAQLLKKVEEYGQTAVAVTDHASCAAWVEMNQICQSVKPIFGNEFYCNPTQEKSRHRDHLVLLAMDCDGLVNIRRLQRTAVEDYYYKPILYYKKLEELPHNGIYCTSACSLSTISKCILENKIAEATKWAEYFNDLFDGNFSLELQFHPDYSDQAIINEQLVHIGEDLGIPLTASFDCHFVNESDRDLRRIMLAISWRKQYNDIDDSLKSNCIGNSFLLRQFAEESGFQHMDLIDGIINETSRISSKCNVRLEEPETRIPVFDKHNEFNKLFEGVKEW